MCGAQKFYICKHCGNLVGMIHNSGVVMVCCGEEMTELVANTVDASQEKHVPVITVNDNEVKVEIGSVPHPMVEDHYIQWVYLLTNRGGQRKCLAPGLEPVVTFAIGDEKPLAAFEYCNIHGLWKADVK